MYAFVSKLDVMAIRVFLCVYILTPSAFVCNLSLLPSLCLNLCFTVSLFCFCVWLCVFWDFWVFTNFLSVFVVFCYVWFGCYNCLADC